jgi:RNA polymerase sigma-70 factor (ECF subfamily)
MSAEETAEAVGSTAGAVRVAQHRALARLKAEIGTTRHDHA